MTTRANSMTRSTMANTSIVFVENMSINQEIPNATLLQDLLCEDQGDEAINKVKAHIKSSFGLEFTKLPFHQGPGIPLFHDICEQMAEMMMDTMTPIQMANVDLNGSSLVKVIEELIGQVKNGGNRFDMVTATEALVSNMASEAAHHLWDEFIEKIKRGGNHPVQINGRKHYRAIMREVEGLANETLIELESFLGRLVPNEPAQVGKQIWDRNYNALSHDIQARHAHKLAEIARFSRWRDRLNGFIHALIRQVMEALGQAIKFARFSASLMFLSNVYVWKQGLSLLRSSSSYFPLLN